MLQFWFPGEPRLVAREELEQRLAEAFIRGVHVQERLARLTRTQRSFLTEVLRRPSHQAEVQAVTQQLERSGSHPLEVESAARMLTERGFLGRKRIGSGDLFVIPEELAQHLQQALVPEHQEVPPAAQLSQKRLPFDIDFEGRTLSERIDSLEDPTLAALTRIAVENYGLAEWNTPGVQEIVGAAHEPAPGEDPQDAQLEHLHLPEWRQALEDSGIGTIGSVSLKDFGILVEEPALVIFQEWIQKRAHEGLHGLEEPDTVLEAGVDLYIDLDRIAMRLEEEPVRLTRGGKIPKRFMEALRASLYLVRLESYLEGDLVDSTIQLAFRLGILESYGKQVQVYQERQQVWRKLDLIRKVEMILERFKGESQGDRWSFHQEALRNILLEFLTEEQPEQWISLDALVGSVLSTYLLELDEREVREVLRQRREEDFVRERLNSSFRRLATDLIYWIVNRFLPLGICELGMQEGKLSAFRLTALGQKVLGIREQPDESRLLVNPDFEIILFHEGLQGMRLELALARFGERVSAERIRRYRVTRESIRYGIRSGLSLAEIRQILRSSCDHPLPEPVLVALGDWGKDLDWIQVEPAILLKGLKPSRARELSKFLRRQRCEHQLCPDGTVVIPGEQLGPHAPGEGLAILEHLRDQGWLVREAPLERPQLFQEEVACKRA